MLNEIEQRELLRAKRMCWVRLPDGRTGLVQENQPGYWLSPYSWTADEVDAENAALGYKKLDAGLIVLSSMKPTEEEIKMME
jgi:hypothetical protein